MRCNLKKNSAATYPTRGDGKRLPHSNSDQPLYLYMQEGIFTPASMRYSLTESASLISMADQHEFIVDRCN